ncbi:ABC transporter ATP-binding protein [Paenibacillus tarimensis]
MSTILIYVKKLHAQAGVILYINLFGMIVLSMLEGVGIFLLLPMLSLVGILDLTASGIPVVAMLAEPVTALPAGLKLSVILTVFILLFAGQALLQRKLVNQNAEIEQRFIRRLRIDIYRSLMQANWPFFLKKRKSDFIHIMTNELARVNYGVTTALRILTTILFTSIQIGIAFWLSAELTISVLLCGLLLALYSRVFIRKSREIGNETTDLMQKYLASISDHFNGIKDVKSNMMEGQHFTRYQSLCSNLEQNVVQFTKVQSKSQYYYKIAAGLFIAAFVFLAFEVLRVPAETLVLIVLIFSRLWPKFTTLQSSMENIAQTLPAFKSLAELQAEYEDAQELDISGPYKTESSVPILHGIECRDIYFRYNGDCSSYALQNINLYLPVNSMTAVVGKSGAGKSTLIDLLIGLIKPEQGEVLIDGKPLSNEGNLSLRRVIGYVSQDPFLFNESIRDNLAIAAPDASEAEMWEALQFSAADEFVGNLPLGLDTVLGDRGIRLSGGERQRIVLARAIMRKPSILVLDEATSALDSDNETKIQEALERLKGKMTIIVIAHRLSTIRNADQVIVMDNGKMIQQGKYQQLSKESDGAFSKLLNYQLSAAR